MIITTTHTIEGHPVVNYLGIVTGLSMSYKKGKLTFNMEKYYDSLEAQVEQLKEDAFQKLRDNALKLKANAVVGVSTDVEIDGTTGGISISVVGTAVVCK
ncbi:heavy metal-binding domain-containing protein [Pontimicrobium sp. IMCC45349]|uniref:heavy metal-binding domain-containing protein n=1 Tax=Pontimicrobium sp. IMCC45349 TaxID=3391574 RepID=UPI0039A095AF